VCMHNTGRSTECVCVCVCVCVVRRASLEHLSVGVSLTAFPFVFRFVLK